MQRSSLKHRVKPTILIKAMTENYPKGGSKLIDYWQREKKSWSYFLKVEWTDLGADGKPITSWERASAVTEFAIDQYNLSLNDKRKRRSKRRQKK
jgi:hypothetical protein